MLDDIENLVKVEAIQKLASLLDFFDMDQICEKAITAFHEVLLQDGEVKTIAEVLVRNCGRILYYITVEKIKHYEEAMLVEFIDLIKVDPVLPNAAEVRQRLEKQGGTESSVLQHPSPCRVLRKRRVRGAPARHVYDARLVSLRGRAHVDRMLFSRGTDSSSSSSLRFASCLGLRCRTRIS